MNILVVSQFFFPEQFILNDLCLELVKRGHKVTVLTGQPNYPKGSIYPNYSNWTNWSHEYQGIKILRVPVYPRKNGSAFHLGLNYLSFIFSSLLFGLPRVFFSKIDIIFGWGTSPLFQVLPALPLKVLRRKPLFIWIQDLWPDTLKAVGMVRSDLILKIVGWGVRLVYLLSDKVLIQSKGFKDSVTSYGARAEKIVWFPNWFQPPSNEEPTESAPHKLSADHFTLLFAGNLGKAQAIETILEAAILLKAEPQIKIYLMGGGSEKDRLMTICAQHELSNIVFLDPRPMHEMKAHFSQADALLITLKDDPIFSLVIPSKVQAYLNAGKPIVGALSGEASRVLNESKAAFLGPAENAKILASNIKNCSESSDKTLRKMGESGKVFNQENFHRDALVTKLEHLFS